MKTPVPGWIGIPALLAYTALGGLALHSILPDDHRPHPGLAFGFLGVFVVGWFWLLGVLLFRSHTAGFRLLRGWLAINGGMAIFVMPMAFFPHPLTIAAGGLCAVAWASWLFSDEPILRRWFRRDRQ